MVVIENQNLSSLLALVGLLNNIIYKSLSFQVKVASARNAPIASIRESRSQPCQFLTRQLTATLTADTMAPIHKCSLLLL